MKKNYLIISMVLFLCTLSYAGKEDYEQDEQDEHTQMRKTPSARHSERVRVTHEFGENVPAAMRRTWDAVHGTTPMERYNQEFYSNYLEVWAWLALKPEQLDIILTENEESLTACGMKFPKDIRRSPDDEGSAPEDVRRFPEDEGRSQDAGGRAPGDRRFPKDKGSAPGDERRFPVAEGECPVSIGRAPDAGSGSLDDEGNPPLSIGRAPDAGSGSLDDEGNPPKDKGRAPDAGSGSLDDEGNPPKDKGRAPDAGSESLDDEGNPPLSIERSPGDERRFPKDKGRAPDDAGRAPGDEGNPPLSIERSPGDERRSQKDKGRSPEDVRIFPEDEERSPEDVRRFPKDKGRAPGDARRFPSRIRRSPLNIGRSPDTGVSIERAQDAGSGASDPETPLTIGRTQADAGRAQDAGSGASDPEATLTIGRTPNLETAIEGARRRSPSLTLPDAGGRSPERARKTPLFSPCEPPSYKSKTSFEAIQRVEGKYYGLLHSHLTKEYYARIFKVTKKPDAQQPGYPMFLYDVEIDHTYTESLDRLTADDPCSQCSSCCCKTRFEISSGEIAFILGREKHTVQLHLNEDIPHICCRISMLYVLKGMRWLGTKCSKRFLQVIEDTMSHPMEEAAGLLPF